jgi:hypothetical protein
MSGAMKFLIVILLVLLILNACVLWLLLVGTLVERLSRAFSTKNKASDPQKAWQPPLTTPENRRSGAPGSFQDL